MRSFHLLLIFILNVTIFAPYTSAQQKYLGNSALDCDRFNETVPSSAVLYTCNAQLPATCKAFLIFRSQPRYNSVSSISNLLSADPGEVSSINNISREDILPLNKEVIVPVKCSCSGLYYQANTSYVIPSDGSTYFIIANNTFQGLSTCSALLRENVYGAEDLVPGMNVTVPLRCACPTRNQAANGVKFLVSYLVIWKDDVSSISTQFGVSKTSVANANGFSEEDTLFPFTTLLIPLQVEPSESQTKIYKAAAYIPKEKQKRSYRSICIGIGAGISLAILCFIVFIVLSRRKGVKTDEALAEKRKAKWKLPEHVRDKIAVVEQFLAIYEYEELEAATENFSLEKRLSSSVYQGVLCGKLSAIKAVNADASSEVKVLTKINHFNVIRLYGVCEHLGVSYLVFEFMANGSLKEWLLQNDGPEVHSWNNRIRIALDVADGLNYIHNFTDPAYVHNNINSGSILLNEHLRAKIADFSLARSAQNETGKVVSPKTDVYAFGVVLLELITGREAVFNQDGKEIMLSETVLQIMDGRKSRNAEAEFQCLLDPRLQVKHQLGYIIDQSELALRLIKLSVACLAQEPAKRPTAAEVVSSLMNIQSDVQNLEALSI